MRRPPVSNFCSILFCLVLLVMAMFATTMADDREVSPRAIALNEEGFQLFKKGDYAKARQRFEQALVLAPQSSSILQNLGMTRAAIGIELLKQAQKFGGLEFTRRALEELEASLLFWSGDASTQHALGWCHFKLGRTSVAAKALALAVELDPKSVQNWLLYATILEQQEKAAEALAALGQALKLRPQDPAIKRRHARQVYDLQAMSTFLSLLDSRFKIYYPPSVSRAHAKQVLAVLDKVSRNLSKRWAISELSGKIVICYPPGEFALRTGLHEDVGGAYDGRIRIAFPKELTAGGLQLEQVVRHEAIHMMLRSVGEQLPRWLDEGLAQHWDHGERSSWLSQVHRLISREPKVGILDRQATFDVDQQKTWNGLYLHSYGFIQDLAKRGGDFRLDMMVREGARGKSWSESFVNVYGDTVEEMDKKWRQRLLKQKP